MAAPTFVDVGANDTNGNSGTSVVISFTGTGQPDIVGEAADDIAIIAIYKESTAAYTATPSGWTQVVGAPWDQSTGGFKYRADLWWRKLDGTETTVTWSWTGATWRYAECVVYRGCVTGETPTVTVVADIETAQNSNPVHPGLTIARTDSGLVWFVFNFADVDNTAAPTGFTFRDPNTITGNPTNLRTYDDLSTAPGASGTVTGNLSGDIEYPLTVLVEIATQAGAAIYEQSDYQFTYGTGGGPPSWVAGAQPAILSATGTADNVAGTTVAAAYPATVAAGDLLIFVVGKDDDATGITDTTGGLTAIGTAGNGGSGTDGVCLGVWYKIASGTEDGTTHTFTGDSEEFQVFCLRILAGAFDPLLPIDSNSTLNGSTGSADATTPAFSAVRAGGLVVACGAVDVSPMDPTFSPAGWTDVADNAAGQVTAFVATRDAATTLAEAVGATNFGIAPTDAWAARAFVINAPQVAAGRIAVDASNTPVVLEVDTSYGAQIRVENTGAAGDDDYQWQRRLNGGTWTNITSSSSVVIATATADFVNGADVPEFIKGSGTYITNNNAALDTTGALVLGAALGAGSSFESHLNFQIISGDVVEGDDIELRLVVGTVTALNTYTSTPTIEVNEAAAAALLPRSYNFNQAVKRAAIW